MKFRAKVIPSGNATAVEVPREIVQALGPEARPPVTVSINGHSWRSRIALMRGLCLVGISAANRAASGIAEGDAVEVLLELDSEPRVVPEPSDLADALDKSPAARAAFDRLPFGLKRKHVTTIEESKSVEVRQRRIAKLIAGWDQPTG
ncbi:YdeI/OmpD-associated family protein [Variovorax robiniae]|uniref:YdeI/OmpD-associated family protein n=1 Tax=Variovorax robiniae TaxID=1836199 RepID=A0ABU8XHX9_9BURK